MTSFDARINAQGLAEIAAILLDNHKHPLLTDCALHAWAEEVEREANRGNPAAFEIPARDSIWGRTFSYPVSEAGIDWVEIDAE